MAKEDIAAAVQRVESVLQRRPATGIHDDAPATARLQSGLRVIASHANGTQMPTDMPSELGGSGDRITPGWLFRAGLASCLTTRIAMGAAAEGIDPCHSLIGNLNQFSAAEILQMSCLSQRSGRFTFKSGRGNSEIYLQHGSVRHAVFGTLEGESAVAEIFRWRQGRFYFEDGIISQVQTVDRPWAHLLIDNLQKLDETLELVSV